MILKEPCDQELYNILVGSLIIGFRMYFLHENELIKLSRKDATATEEERILKEPCDQEPCNILVRNCKQICISEGFPDGRCKGFMRKCICGKPCMLN
uniref:Knottins-like domain-containing protein n=1 Tax=Brassica oleracea var. oleracea TaxID=109376 RepID=A0A0D3BE73_BRAOL